MAREILTVGHSTHSIEAFLGLLSQARVGTVADVRRYPGSRRHPHFGAPALAAALREAGMRYEHLPQLGGRRTPRRDSPNRAWRVDAFRGYADHLSTREFASGLEQLEALAGADRSAIMCAEALWSRCHRRLLADVLLLRGWRVLHLLPDGRLREHELTPFAIAAENSLPRYPEGAPARPDPHQRALWESGETTGRG
ncbi:MAG: DUF488 domain-containing protein [Actinobacteria bacterium]|nr:MAG: DUF488 domain-containing protein [Actinomycetota bacterium]